MRRSASEENCSSPSSPNLTLQKRKKSGILIPLPPETDVPCNNGKRGRKTKKKKKCVFSSLSGKRYSLCLFWRGMGLPFRRCREVAKVEMSPNISREGGDGWRCIAMLVQLNIMESKMIHFVWC